MYGLSLEHSNRLPSSSSSTMYDYSTNIQSHAASNNEPLFRTLQPVIVQLPLKHAVVSMSRKVRCSKNIREDYYTPSGKERFLSRERAFGEKKDYTCSWMLPKIKACEIANFTSIIVVLILHNLLITICLCAGKGWVILPQALE
jgi:hypothetical protein